MQKSRKDKNFIKKPIYPGGVTAMRKFIGDNLVYPKEALEKKIEGTVTLKFAIDHLGSVIQTHVIAGLGHGCDEEAERIVRLLKFEVPKTRGVKVQFHKDIHVYFRLPKKKVVAQNVVAQNVIPQYIYTADNAKPTKSYNYTVTITPPNKKQE